jgi:hypothetical protein
MATVRDLAVHVNDEAVSSHAFELATSLAAELGANLTALLVAAPVDVGVGLSAETASLAQQLEQAQRGRLYLTLASASRLAHGNATTWPSICGSPLAIRSRRSDPMPLLRI